MANLEKVYDKDTQEYQRIAMAGELIKSETHGKFYGKPKKIYFDYGQNWVYTALVVYDSSKDERDILNGFQINPVDYELIVGGDADDFAKAIINILGYSSLKGNY